MSVTEESRRLEACSKERVPWKKWGPYLSERQWGTVREDYSADGDAWDYFTHDQSRSRAYRWGEDGLGGICDDKQRLCFALALWNGRDPILKERLFGADQRRGQPRRGRQGVLLLPRQHADPLVHEVPLQVPAGGRSPTPTCPRPARSRSRAGLGIRAARHGRLRRQPLLRRGGRIRQGVPEDILIRITAFNRGPRGGPAARPAHLLVPQHLGLGHRRRRAQAQHPGGRARASPRFRIEHPELGEYVVRFEGEVPLLFTENETNQQRLFGKPNAEPVRQGRLPRLRDPADGRTRSTRRGWAPRRPPTTSRHVAPGQAAVIRLRLTRGNAGLGARSCRQNAFDAVLADRVADADDYLRVPSRPPPWSSDQRRVMRQALAGHVVEQAVLLLRSRSLAGRARAARRPAGTSRNRHWNHMVNDDILSMPDKWEYPWYAAWDLAFHTVALGMVDPRLRPRSDRADAVRALPAPQRPDAGLRVELRRREPAGSRLGHAVLLLTPAPSGPAASDRAFLASGLPEAAAELHLVGEPQGSRGQQPVRGRLSGPGQHRGLRPQRHAALGRAPGAGRRHRLDGVLLPEHAGDGPGAGPRRSRRTSPW